MPDASPTKWHRAHVTWFFETFLLKPFHPTYVELDEVYGFLFNSYEANGLKLSEPAKIQGYDQLKKSLSGVSCSC